MERLGHLGDMVGHKAVLLICLFLMVVSTIAVGLLPTYAQIGMLAPVLLVVSRVVQGFAVAGELTGASSMVLEHAPFGQRGFLASFAMHGAASEQILAAAVFLPLTSSPLAACCPTTRTTPCPPCEGYDRGALEAALPDIKAWFESTALGRSPTVWTSYTLGYAIARQELQKVVAAVRPRPPMAAGGVENLGRYAASWIAGGEPNHSAPSRACSRSSQGERLAATSRPRTLHEIGDMRAAPDLQAVQNVRRPGGHPRSGPCQKAVEL